MRFLLAACCVLSLSAGDLSGIWIGQFISRPGADPQDIAFQIAHSGSKLSGKLYGEFKSDPIVDGVVAGDLVTFVVLATEQAGNQINETRLRFTGSLSNGELELVRERESSSNAGNGGVVQTRPNSGRQVVKLKRLT